MARAAEKAYNAVILIPAFEEAGFIEKVLPACMQAKRQGLVRDVLVVNDGSRDRGRTAKIAAQFGAKVISNKKRTGKGSVFLQGIAHCRKNNAEIMVTLDADLLNLGVGHIRELLSKVSRKGINMAVMSVIEKAGAQLTTYSGQRAVKVNAFNFLLLKGRGKEKYIKPAARFIKISHGYGLEVALNRLPVLKMHQTTFRPKRELRARKQEVKGLPQRAEVDMTGDALLARSFKALALRKKRKRARQARKPK